MTINQFEQKVEDVKKAWPYMADWIKNWSRERLKEMQKEIK